MTVSRALVDGVSNKPRSQGAMGTSSRHLILCGRYPDQRLVHQSVLLFPLQHQSLLNIKTHRTSVSLSLVKQAAAVDQMQCWHRRAGTVGHGALSSGSWSISQPQLTLSRQPLHISKRHGMHSSQQKQRMLGFSGADPSSTKPSSGVATNAHRTAVSLQQRPRHTQEHSNHGHNHHHRQLKDDGSLKVG